MNDLRLNPFIGRTQWTSRPTGDEPHYRDLSPTALLEAQQAWDAAEDLRQQSQAQVMRRYEEEGFPEDAA